MSLATTGSDQGEVTAIWQGYQAGNLNGRASIWHGAAQSRVDLDPGSVIAPFGSFIFSMRGPLQAGYVVGPGVIDHAALWTGTAASFVDLNPAGSSNSFAYATDGAHQGGVATIGGNNHAAFWSGTAASFIDLSPAPGYTAQVNGMAPGQQAGWYNTLTSPQHAALWSGTAASLIDLHPFPGFGSSILNATDGLVQVGDSDVPGGGSFAHAGIWFGTAASFVDLQAFLPAGYSSSTATSVYEANGLIYVGGIAANPLSLQSEAFLWVSVPAPGSGAAMLLCACALTRRRRGRFQIA